MMTKLSIAIAAGLLLAGPAFAGDQDMTRDQVKDRTQLKDGTGDGTPDRIRDQLQLRDRDATAEAELAVAEGEESAAAAREQVRAALAEQAGMPSDRPALPGEGTGVRAAERHALQARKAEAEKAALRHTERHMTRVMAGEGEAARVGAGPAAGHGAMGPGAGECTEAADTTRSGGMRGVGPMSPGGMR